jgi:hypothetical protein
MNSRETIHIDGYPVRLVRYSGPFFRTDYTKSTRNRANEYFKVTNGQSFDKYFTKTNKEAKIYHRPHLTEWMSSEPLRLVDMFDVETRQSLDHLINPRDLNISFPMKRNNNKPPTIYRYSETDDASHDNAVLDQLCGLGNGIDGYYMEEQVLPPGSVRTKHPILNKETIRSKFHSEIGICKGSLHKLRLEHSANRLAPPPMQRKSKMRNTHTVRRSNAEGKKWNNNIFASVNNQKSLKNFLANDDISAPSFVDNNNNNHNANSPSLNLTTMIEGNRPFFGLLSPSTPTKKRSGNNKMVTSPKKTPKRNIDNSPQTPPRKTIKRSLFPSKNKNNISDTNRK